MIKVGQRYRWKFKNSDCIIEIIDIARDTTDIKYISVIEYGYSVDVAGFEQTIHCLISLPKFILLQNQDRIESLI